MQKLVAPKFPDYELLDCGEGEKLERFGEVITIRPEPHAKWPVKLTESRWKELAHWHFIQTSANAGKWNSLKKAPREWQISYPLSEAQSIKFQLSLTKFKHLGIFPEQAAHWDFIYDQFSNWKIEKPKFLNLFAYTGGASLSAKAAGADVTHVDSIKQVVTWANKNMQLSGLDNIRWLVEDAMKYAKREVKRGKKYHGIILDPPAFGHGPKGASWKLEKHLEPMMELVFQLLNERQHFLILNVYASGFGTENMEKLLRPHLSKKQDMEFGELFLRSSKGDDLSCGVFGKVVSR